MSNSELHADRARTVNSEPMEATDAERRQLIDDLAFLVVRQHRRSPSVVTDATSALPQLVNDAIAISGDSPIHPH